MAPSPIASLGNAHAPGTSASTIPRAALCRFPHAVFNGQKVLLPALIHTNNDQSAQLALDRLVDQFLCSACNRSFNGSVLASRPSNSIRLFLLMVAYLVAWLYGNFQSTRYVAFFQMLRALARKQPIELFTGSDFAVSCY